MVVVQSVPIINTVVSSNPVHGTRYNIKNNKTDLYDITEILLKVALNTIALTLDPIKEQLFISLRMG
jgi:hypothetical protein